MAVARVSIKSLGRYPLSIILSFLTEKEGVRFLLTRKRYAKLLLPQFRVEHRGNDVWAGLSVAAQRRCHYLFVAAPNQDSNTLLDQLNTRRLIRRRRLPPRGMSTTDLALHEWKSNKIEKFPPLLRFVDPKTDPLKHTGTLLVSYPRSGNTLLRTLLERVTTIVTGSDTRPDRSLSIELAQKHGLVGEGVTEFSRVLFVKSHWPERTGHRVYPVQRVVLLVRNPYDAIDSFFNLNATNTHTETVTDAVYEQVQDKFDRLVRNEAHVWIKFHAFWWNNPTVPVLVVRFEDLIQNPEREVERILEFSFNKPLSSAWKQRIQAVTNANTESLGSYRPRTSGNNFGKSIKKGRYSPQLLDYTHSAASSYPENFLHLFGYSLRPEGFPSVIVPLAESIKRREPGSSTTSIVKNELQVNQGSPVRPVDCEFGRAMREWRRSLTMQDSQPFPTVHKR